MVDGDISKKWAVCVLVFLSLLPFGGIWFLEDWVISIAYSEFPVKSWCYTKFWSMDRFWGGQIGELGFPTGKVLNNPDVFATLIVGGLWKVIGLSRAYNLMLALVCNYQ